MRWRCESTLAPLQPNLLPTQQVREISRTELEISTEKREAVVDAHGKVGAEQSVNITNSDADETLIFLGCCVQTQVRLKKFVDFYSRSSNSQPEHLIACAP